MTHISRRKLLSAAATSVLALASPPVLAQSRSPVKGKAIVMSPAPPPAPKTPAPPVARRGDYRFTRHGITIDDPYAWLKDKDYPKVDDAEVLAYLKAENTYFEQQTAPMRPLIDSLFTEMKARLKEDDASVPVRDGDWLTWWQFDKGAQYRTWWRRPVAGGPDQLILSEPDLASGLEYFRLGTLSISPDGRRVAYAADIDGSERFTLKIRDLATGQDLPDAIPGTLGEIVWAADSQSLFYTPVNDNWRPFAVRHHRLGSDPAEDRTIYTEADPGFFVGVGRTQSRRFLTIGASDHTTSEVRLLPLDDPHAEPLLVSPRVKDREYAVDERDGTLFILVNDTHPNFRLVEASLDAPNAWSEVIAASDSHYLLSHVSFANWLVVHERVNGLDQIRLRDLDGREHYVPFPEASYAAGLGGNPEYRLDKLRLAYQSMVTPQTVFDYDPQARALTTRKVQEIPSGYDASQYVTERLMVPARDGAMIPVSIVYRKDRQKSGPLHLYGYGAYGLSIPPGFSTVRLSFLDRGFTYAIAHIRGGDDLGRRWYLDGRAEKRWNTFHDFLDVADFLCSKGYAVPGGISISGGSAGGELMGVAANMRPELWRAVVAHVPFVDVLNTMLDDTLPLTPMEWPEWGNPIESADAFALIRSYSPYDNVTAQAYPPMMVTAGLNDPRVTYWEPAKWVAKLRATKTDSNLLLLKTNMGAGHGGKSGRFDSLIEDAEELAFLLRAFGLAG